MNRSMKVFLSGVLCLFGFNVKAAVFQFDFWGDHYATADFPVMSGSFILDTLTVDSMGMLFSSLDERALTGLNDVAGGIRDFTVDVAGIGRLPTPETNTLRAEALFSPPDFWVTTFTFALPGGGWMGMDDIDASFYVTQEAWMTSTDPLGEFLDALLSSQPSNAVWWFDDDIYDDELPYLGELHLDGTRITPVPAPTAISSFASLLVGYGLVHLGNILRRRRRG